MAHRRIDGPGSGSALPRPLLLAEIGVRLAAALDDERSSMLAAATYIEETPLLARHVLQLANSALSGRRGSISDPRQAAVMLGVDRLRKLAIDLSGQPHRTAADISAGSATTAR